MFLDTKKHNQQLQLNDTTQRQQTIMASMSLTISTAFEKAMKEASTAFASECIKSLALEYGIDEEEALAMVGILTAKVTAVKVTKSTKSTSSTADKRNALGLEARVLMDKLSLTDEVPAKIGELTKLITQLKRQLKAQEKEDKAQEKINAKNKKTKSKLQKAASNRGGSESGDNESEEAEFDCE